MWHRRLMSLSRYGGATGIVCRIFDSQRGQRVRVYSLGGTWASTFPRSRRASGANMLRLLLSSTNDFRGPI
jgi:hypothetical protein